jgi:hypothetical protein
MKAPLGDFRAFPTYSSPYSARWQKASGQVASTLAAERIIDIQLDQPRRGTVMLRTDGSSAGNGAWLIEAGSAYAVVRWTVTPSANGQDLVLVAGQEVRVTWQPGGTPVAGTAEASYGVTG